MVDEEQQQVELQAIPQLVNPGEVDEPMSLPSFLYVPGELDFPEGSLALPWEGSPEYVIGELARKRGAESPTRLVASAKSWLSHAAVNRSEPILPWGAPEEIPKVSPVDASARYLAYLRQAWDHRLASEQPELAFEAQEILLTVPASFDEEARELTLQAAQQAGLQQVTLLEEPQAAFYAWLEHQGDRWRDQVQVGDLILVCDVGGGTTDFSLITVADAEGDLMLERAAVGDHILLGGDNMDLALARLLQQRLEEEGHRVDTWQLYSLWHQCRLAKERLFASPRTQKQAITLLGTGTRLVGGTIQTTLTREDLNQVVVDGFFPDVSSEEMPMRQRRIGLQELGLPYAADAAITKHLARFLTVQSQDDSADDLIRRGKSGLACPTHVLFNGGVMQAQVTRDRVVAVLNKWLQEEGFDPLRVLDAVSYDQAVARGATYYGQARQGKGVRIRSGAPRTYYIGIESAMPAIPGMPAPLKALCVVPFGMEEGTEAQLSEQEFGLVVGETAEFRFLSSTVRKQDPIGTMIEDWGDEIEELNPLEVTLELEGQEDSVLPVRLESHVTELGTLELWCVSRDGGHRWKLEFNIREQDQ
ncbi:Hsp70 family protein [Candidatus Entotheonella palauensis]|uniref:Hsp70 family protein n=1 Tax=Candidatus Entotheonella palauensis TaxID=93172 RepID=UPI000B7E67E2|nr:Hsp70 family protein [Candidatus Entotheonella palauensis]